MKKILLTFALASFFANPLVHAQEKVSISEDSVRSLRFEIFFGNIQKKNEAMIQTDSTEIFTYHQAGVTLTAIKNLGDQERNKIIALWDNGTMASMTQNDIITLKVLGGVDEVVSNPRKKAQVKAQIQRAYFYQVMPVVKK